MKKLIHKLAWAAARWALSYVGEGTAWLLDRAADRAADSRKTRAVAEWAEMAAGTFALFGGALKDGSVTPEERAAVAEAAQRMADRAKEVLA